jgi:GT2 family glycosyltransferase
MSQGTWNLHSSTLPAPQSHTTTPGRLRTVCAVIPCFGRPDDLAAILSDLRDTILPSGYRLHVTVIDNASPTPIAWPEGVFNTRQAPRSLLETQDHHRPQSQPQSPVENQIQYQLYRLARNEGGSGGFNAGMRLALQGHPADLLWLLDSDARISPETLRTLIRTLDEHPHAWAVGPAIATDPASPPHEIGGRLDARDGTLGTAFTSSDTPCSPAIVDYVPACCLLARAPVVLRHGLMPDVFLNGDDSEWCIQLSKRSGGVVLVDPSARAFHPRFDRHATWARFYQSRNAFGAIAAQSRGRRTVRKRAWVEVRRAINQALLGRYDLAKLHLRGLGAATANDRTGPCPDELRGLLASQPLSQLQQGEPAAPRSLLARLLMGPPRGTAIVDAKGGPGAWLAAKTLIIRDGASAVTLQTRWPRPIFHAIATVATGAWLTARLWLTPPQESKLPILASDLVQTIRGEERIGDDSTSLSIIVLSFNRKDSLATTLRTLHGLSPAKGAQLIVVDNASTDGSGEMVASEFPDVTLIRLPVNVGVAGFNRGVAAATGSIVLILDDDAAPDAQSLHGAMEHLQNHPGDSAVALHPVHPRTGASEWPFARSVEHANPATAWPVMGAGNLVRRTAWIDAGGYEERFFLYRNDTDLAMKLLAMGGGVAFSPAWVVWHDSPAAARKSPRWCEMATRNWLWLARRHGRGISGIFGALAGWAWAHRLSGFSPELHIRVLRGAWQGLTERSPRVGDGIQPDGSAFRSLLKLQLGRSRRGSPRIESRTVPSPVEFGGGATAGASNVGQPLETPLVASSSSSARHSA